MNCVWFSSDNGGQSTTTTNYTPVNAVLTANWSTTENIRQTVISEDITITQVDFFSDAAPGASKSYDYTLRDDAADTSITWNVSGAVQTSASWTGSVAIAAGSLFALKAVPTGTPTAPTLFACHIYYTTASNHYLIPGCSATSLSTDGTINYTAVQGGNNTAFSATELHFQAIVPTGITMTKLLFALPNGSPGSGKSYAAMISKNNAASDELTATISDTATSQTTTGSVAWSAGDTYVMKITNSGTPTARRAAWCLTVVPDTDGEMMYGYGGSAALSTSTTQYEQPIGLGGNGWNGTESARWMYPADVEHRKLYVKVSVAPGVGTSRTFTMRDNASDSALTATVSGTNTTANDTTHSYTPTGGGATGSIKSSMSGTPAAANLHVGYVVYIAQPAAGTTFYSTMLMMGV